MPKTTFEIQGLIGLQAALERASEEIRVQFGKAVEETALALVDHAKAKVPVDEGDLRDAIIATGGKQRWRVGVAGGPASGRGGASSHQYPAVYGRFVEFGTKSKAARPFMRPAVDAEQERFIERLSKVVL